MQSVHSLGYGLDHLGGSTPDKGKTFSYVGPVASGGPFQEKKRPAHEGTDKLDTERPFNNTAVQLWITQKHVGLLHAFMCYMLHLCGQKAMGQVPSAICICNCSKTRWYKGLFSRQWHRQIAKVPKYVNVCTSTRTPSTPLWQVQQYSYCHKDGGKSSQTGIQHTAYRKWWYQWWQLFSSFYRTKDAQ